MATATGNQKLAQGTWNKLDKHLQTRILEISKAKKNGTKIIGVFPGDWVPEELIHAAGAVSLGLILGGEPDPLEASHSVLPRFICPFARAACGYGLVPDRPMYKLPDLYVDPVSCQSMRRVGDIYSYYLNANVFKLGIPHFPWQDDHLNYYKGTLQELAKTLEELTGKPLGDLKTSIDLYNRIRSALLELSQMRKSPNPPISGKEFIKLNHASLIGDPEVVAEILESLVQELQAQEVEGKGPRLMITGPCIAQGDWQTLDLVEEMGARIVVEDVVEGMRYYWRNIKTDGDLMDNLAKGYLRDRRLWPFTVGSTEVRSENLFAMAKEFNADGILWYQLKYCECYDMESFYNAEKASEKGVPFLKLQSEYQLEDRGSTKTRIEAFLETIGN